MTAGYVRTGIDLGGTKISVLAFDKSDSVIAHERLATPRNDYDGVVRTIRELVEQFETRFGQSTVGIGMPGSISPQTGRVQNANSIWMNGRDFQNDVDQALKRPVRLANDANCFALSEATDGAARDAGIVFGVILGTGCGGGIVVNRKLLVGPHNIAGEWGHNPLPWPRPDEHPGPECWCGRTGCLETWISGTGLEQDYLHATGAELSGQDIAEAAAAGDPDAEAALERLTDRLARGLAHVANMIDPDVIVLGWRSVELDTALRQDRGPHAALCLCGHTPN